MLILSRMKRYTPEEISNISQNFRYIVQKCSLSKSALSAIGDKISPNTYNRLYRYDSSSQWCPQEKTLKNIIDYFNENFFPSITIYDLIHKNLENNNFSPIQKLDCLKYYEGMYHCYYFTSDGDCHYGLLRIWNSHEGTSSYECEAVLGFFYEHFKEFKSKLNGNISLKKLYTQYTDKSNYVTFNYYSGSINLLERCIILLLTSPNNTFSRVISINRYDNLENSKKYNGGIGSMMTVAHHDKPLVFQSIGLSITDIDDESENMKHLLMLQNSDSDYVIKNNITSNRNREWFHLILGKKSNS